MVYNGLVPSPKTVNVISSVRKHGGMGSINNEVVEDDQDLEVSPPRGR